MSKHLGPLLKIDNTGTKWYRKVTNVGDTRISAGTLCEIAYDWRTALTYTMQNLPTLSADYNLVKAYSGEATTTYHPGALMGVALVDIPAYSNITHTGLPTGWVQYRGACPVSTRCSVTAGSAVIPSSSSGVVGVGHVMMAGCNEDAMSAGIGLALSTAGAANACGWTWVYLMMP